MSKGGAQMPPGKPQSGKIRKNANVGQDVAPFMMTPIPDSFADVEQTNLVIGGEVPASILHKTKLCLFYRQGKCKRGAKCTFAHTETELAETPDLGKTKLCKALLDQGRCNNPRCRYAHSRAEVRSLNDCDGVLSNVNSVPLPPCPETALPDCVMEPEIPRVVPKFQGRGGGPFDAFASVPGTGMGGAGGMNIPQPPVSFLYQKNQGQLRPSKSKAMAGPMMPPCNAMEAMAQGPMQPGSPMQGHLPLPQQAHIPGLDGFPYAAPRQIGPLNAGLKLPERPEMNVPINQLNMPVPTTMTPQPPQSTSGLENFAQMAYSPVMQAPNIPDYYQSGRPKDEIRKSRPDTSEHVLDEATLKLIRSLSGKDAVYLPRVQDSFLEEFGHNFPPRDVEPQPINECVKSILCLLHPLTGMLDQLSSPSNAADLEKREEIKCHLDQVIALLKLVQQQTEHPKSFSGDAQFHGMGRGEFGVSEEVRADFEQINTESEEVEHIDTDDDSQLGCWSMSRQTTNFESVPAFSRQVSAWGLQQTMFQVNERSSTKQPSQMTSQSLSEDLPPMPDDEVFDAGLMHRQLSVESHHSINEIANELGYRCLVKNTFIDFDEGEESGKKSKRKTRSMTPRRKGRSVSPPQKKCVEQLDFPDLDFSRSTTQ